MKKQLFLIVGTLFFIITILGIVEIFKQQSIDTILNLQNLTDVNFIITAEKSFPNEMEIKVYKNLTDNSICTVKDNFVNYNILYKSGEYEVTGIISAPADYLEKKYPILIHNRGGYDDYGKENFGITQAFASYGFIVLASNYRGVDGGAGKDEYGGDDVNDVRMMVSLAERFSFGNGKIYMHGWSRGGMMTYCVLKGGDTRIDAAVVFAAPSDLIREYNERELQFKKILVRAIGGNPIQLPEEYKKRSALFWGDEIDTPLLIIQGELDNRVNVEQARELYDKMKYYGKDVELKILPDSGHDVYPEILYTVTQWLLLK